MKLHYIITLAGGTASQPWTKTWTDVYVLEESESRAALYEDILHKVWEEDREMFPADPGSADAEDPVTLFFSLEPDELVVG